MKSSAANRSCGECQACCQAKKIPALDLPAWVTCPHQSPGGCAIYPRRPRGCQAYTCAWVDGWGTETQRPDRIGMIFELGAGPFGGLEVRGVELGEGGRTRPGVQLALQDWTDTGVTLTIQEYGS